MGGSKQWFECYSYLLLLVLVFIALHMHALLNINTALGGKWMLKLKKGIASRYWEEVVLAIIGEQFDVGAEICGAVISIRTNEDIISIWNKTADNKEAVDKIRCALHKIQLSMFYLY